MTASSHHRTSRINKVCHDFKQKRRNHLKPALFRSKKLHVIPEDVREDDEEGSESGGSDEDSQDSGDDDIEDLLAPQDQNKEQE